MTTQDTSRIAVPAGQLRVMPLHAVTEVYRTPGLHARLALELDQLPEPARAMVADAAAWAGQSRCRRRFGRQ